MPRLAPAIKVERRQQLIEAAWRCVADRGFKTLTVDEVCAEAGVSKGAFYVYFAQKQDLLSALLADEAQQIDGVMSMLDRANIKGVERLRRFARAMIERGEDPARVQIHADLWGEMSSDPQLRDQWINVVRTRRETLRDWIERSVASSELKQVPANALAAILLALGDGLLVHAGLDSSGFRWVNVATALDAILDGIAAT